MPQIKEIVIPICKPKVNLYEENNKWFMELKVEDNDRIVTFHKIDLSEIQANFQAFELSHTSVIYYPTGTISFSLLSTIPEGEIITTENKTKKMTLKDIEEKLGHPVEIISEKHGSIDR